jgi:hypothetical protein
MLYAIRINRFFFDLSEYDFNYIAAFCEDIFQVSGPLEEAKEDSDFETLGEMLKDKGIDYIEYIE